MRLISKLPDNYIEKSVLISRLKEISIHDDGLYDKTLEFIKQATPLLDLVIAGPFKEYTLHNSLHSKKIMHIADNIIDSNTINTLSALELSIIIMSCYLHDLGMCLTETEKGRILQSKSFITFIKSNTVYYSRLEKKRNDLKNAIEENDKLVIENDIYQLQEAALSSYLRPEHANSKRYYELIKLILEESNRKDLFDISGFSFLDELIEVCVSHNESSNCLIESKGLYKERFPRKGTICGMRLNLQFCSAILRIIDILDFDRERTPHVLFSAIGVETKKLPGYEISLKEWNKHLSIHTIIINDDEIVISSDCKFPVIEKCVREFAQIIEREIRDTIAILKENAGDIVSDYKLNIPISVRVQIRPIGYTFKDLAIRLNESAIINLLMGDRLYSNSEVALRELLQNSVEACIVRQRIEEKSDYVPLICVSFDKINNDYTLIIEDNGIGMDEYILSEYFFKIGNSFYNSEDFNLFRESYQLGQYSSISRFGIGFLSVFLIGDVIIVESQSVYSIKKDFKHRVITIEGTNSLAFVQESDVEKKGTTIKVILKKSFQNEASIKKMLGYIKENIVRTPIKIDIKNPIGDGFSIFHDLLFTAVNPKYFKKLESFNIYYISIDFSRFSDSLEGRCIMFFKKVKGTYTFLNKSEFEWGKEPFKQPLLLINYKGGNRVTVNGFMMRIKKIGNLLSSNSVFIPCIIDIDITNTKGITYDVSRDRIIGKGLINVRKEILNAISKGLKSKGLYDDLTEETKAFLDNRERAFVSPTAIDTDLSNRIIALLPKDHWPTGIHREIAEKLNVSNAVITRHMKALLFMKKIRNPNEN